MSKSEFQKNVAETLKTVPERLEHARRLLKTEYKTICGVDPQLDAMVDAGRAAGARYLELHGEILAYLKSRVEPK